MDFKQVYSLAFKAGMASLLCLFALSASSQSLLRESMGSMGGSVTSSGITLQTTLGQPSNTESSFGYAGVLRQGFLQPQMGKNKQSFAILPLAIYPNPSTNIFFIQTQMNPGDRYTITSITGAVVMEQTIALEGSLEEFSLEGKATGVYIFSYYRNNALSSTTKLVLIQ